MRRYRRLGMATMLAGLALYWFLPIVADYARAWFEHLKTADPKTLADSAETRLVYEAKPSRWLSFRLPENSRLVRVISTAHVIRPDIYALDPNWDYSFNYELHDHQGRILKKGLYHLRTGLTAYKDGDSVIGYDNYYADRDVQPLDSRAMLFNLKGFDNAALLRLSLGPSNPEIAAAAFRVYVPGRPSAQNLATEWLRMSQRQRDKLADKLIYPAFLLSDREIKKLLANQWQPLGAEGIAGKDYRKRILYSLQDRQTPEADEALPLAQGLQADARHAGVIAIPEQGGPIELYLKTLDGQPLTSQTRLELDWYGRDPEQRWQQQALWRQATDRLRYRLDGGFLVVKPSAPALILAYLGSGPSKRDISDALLSIKTYPAQAGIDYAVLHFRDYPANLRIAVRRLMARGEKTAPGSVRYQFLDDSRQILNEGELPAPAEPSPFDRLGDLIEQVDVSDPGYAYFQVPAAATRLRLSASDPSLLVSVYNQPHGFNKLERVPENYYFDSEQKVLSQSWFPLRAVNDPELVRQNAIRWISGQVRPPQDDPDRLAGRYLWQDYRPQGAATGRYFLADYDDRNIRPEALASVYCRLPTGRDLTVAINALPGLTGISPELLRLDGDDRPFTVNVYLDGDKLLDAAGMGRQSVFRLPQIAPGRHRLRLDSSGAGQWWLNRQDPCPGKRLLKRRAFALAEGDGLEFIVTHAAADERLSAHWYPTARRPGRVRIRVGIEAVKPLATAGFGRSSAWTFKNREFDIRPPPSPAALPVLYSQGLTLGDGERFALALNSDLPAGAYRLRFTLADGEAGYLSLSQTLPGRHEQHRFFKEAHHEPD